MAKILMVEDAPDVIEKVQVWLERKGHKLDIAQDGDSGYEYITGFQYDAIILDIELPGRSGLDLCRTFRAGGGLTPVIMLTGRDSVDDKVKGFDAGADDYLSKPFDLRELSARLQALLRRPLSFEQEEQTFKDLTLKKGSCMVFRNGQPIPLQPLEYSVLEFFMRYPREIFSVEALLSRVWDTDSAVSIDAVYSCIKRLRRKLDSGGTETYIKSVYRTGYGLNSEE